MIYADIISGMIFVQNRKEYMRDHLGHHKRSVFTTSKDADAQTLIYLGFTPRKTIKSYYLLLFFSILNPVFHFKFLFSRFRSSIVFSPFITKVVATLSFAIILFSVYLNLEFSFFALILPLFVFYNISALIQFLTEHLWLTKYSPPASIDEYKERCWARFCGVKKKDGLLGTILWIAHLCFCPPFLGLVV